MKKLFRKRLVAFLIDVLILYLLSTAVSVFIPTFGDIQKNYEDMNNITKGYVNILCNYLITNSKNATNQVENIVYPEIDDSIKAVATVAGENDEYYVVGPFKVNSNGVTNSNNYTISLSTNESTYLISSDVVIVLSLILYSLPLISLRI